MALLETMYCTDCSQFYAPHVYEGYIVYEGSKRVLYVEVIQAIYGMLMSALLSYRKFRAELEDFGFEFNPYDACVANRMVNGNQQTIRFHVDDLMASHVDPEVNNELHCWIEYMYGDLGPVKYHRGNEHDYLGVIYRFNPSPLGIWDRRPLPLSVGDMFGSMLKSMIGGCRGESAISDIMT